MFSSLRYDRDWLLSVHVLNAPTITVQRRIRDLGLWTVCRLIDYRRSHVSYLRRDRGQRAGRPRRPVPALRPACNGAFFVSCQSARRVMNGHTKSRTLTQLRHCSSADSSSAANQLDLALLNILSLANKVDDLLEIRRDRSIDVLCLVEKWHGIDTDAVGIRCLRADGFQVFDHA